MFKNSFILTMRNVNVELVDKPLSLINEFYLNYEECKFWKLIISARFIAGFILTMRNVNNTVVFEGLKHILSFILTMRNVNQSSC